MLGFGDKQKRLNKKLMEAARSGSAEDIRRFLDKGANVNSEDEGGNTPLIQAASRGHTGCVQLLVARGANKDKTVRVESYIWTALNFARNNGYRDIISLLDPSVAQKELNARLAEAAKNGNLDDLRQALEEGADINCYRGTGDSPLHTALFYDRADCAKLLLEKGADINIKNGCERTPLTDLARFEKKKMMSVLVDFFSSKSVADPAWEESRQDALRYLQARISLHREMENLIRPPRTLSSNEIVIEQPLGDRVLQERFNFKTRERISLLRKEVDGPVEAMTRERFEVIETDPSLREAFNEHVRRGGTVEESEIFPHTLFKRPARLVRQE